MSSAPFELESDKDHSFNMLALSKELLEEMNQTVIVLVRAGQHNNVSIAHKQLAWEVIKYLRAEWREMRSTGASGGDLAKALGALMPQVNVQVNVDRKKLQYKAENAMTERLRNVARNQLAKLDAAAGRQQPPPIQQPTINQPSTIDADPIQAAEKLEGTRT